MGWCEDDSGSHRMIYDSVLRHRRSIRLRGYDYSRPGTYFVTVCTHRKEHLLGEVAEGDMKPSQCGEIVGLHWRDLPRHYPQIRLDSFVVMPNHVHGTVEIVGPNRESAVGAIHESSLPATSDQNAGSVHAPPNVGAIHELPLRMRRGMLLAKIVGRFKMTTAKRINEIRGTPGHPVWQRNYYEHIVRNPHELDMIQDYIAHNPLRWDTDPENVMP